MKRNAWLRRIRKTESSSRSTLIKEILTYLNGTYIYIYMKWDPHIWQERRMMETYS